MSLFVDLDFFVSAAALSIPAVILGVMEKPIRYYGFAVTLFFIWMSMGSNPVVIAYLTGYCMIQLLLVKGYAKLVSKLERSGIMCWLFVILSISPLIIYKISGFFDHSIFGFLGISYMTFKSVQMIIEIYDKLIDEVNGLEFVYFLTFFPCLTSGPIDRSRRFHQDYIQQKPRKEYLETVGQGLFKICLGLMYKTVFASAFWQCMMWIGDGTSIKLLTVYAYSYGFYLFFDFAGYSLMAIGLGYIFGVICPQNFDKPFISIDIKEFWNRWHITLSHWFRDFIFSRIMMKSIKGKWFKSKLTAASLGFMVNMTLMGIWHGLDVNFILYGVYHGILLSITEIYQKKSRFYKKHKKNKLYKFISWGITFNLVMFGFFIFSGKFNEVIGLYL